MTLDSANADERDVAAALTHALDGPVAAAASVPAIELLRIGNNYVYADTANRRLYRALVSEADSNDLIAANDRISALVARGAPFVGPLAREPLQLETGHLATVWPLGNRPDPDPAVSLAPTLASLHATPPIGGLPTWSGFDRARGRLRVVSEGTPDDLVAELAQRLDDLEATFPSWHADLLVHGDAHLGNLVELDGRHLLIDLDDIALGCPEIDLAPTRVSYRRFPTVPGSWAEMRGAYGRPIDSDLVESFAELRELTMLSWLLTLWDARAESRSEALHRIATLDTDASWTPL